MRSLLSGQQIRTKRNDQIPALRDIPALHQCCTRTYDNRRSFPFVEPRVQHAALDDPTMGEGEGIRPCPLVGDESIPWAPVSYDNDEKVRSG